MRIDLHVHSSVSDGTDSPTRLVVVLSMLDVADKHGLQIDTDPLAEALGCPVVRHSCVILWVYAVRAHILGPQDQHHRQAAPS